MNALSDSGRTASVESKWKMEKLSDETVRTILGNGLAGKFKNQKVLVLIPDFTRTIPLHRLFRPIVDILSESKKVDFMVALGTHPALSEIQLCQLVGITKDERENRFSQIGLLNHEYASESDLIKIATLKEELIREIAGAFWHESMAGDVPVKINKKIFDYDEIIILGPTFPHEVVGFSGGAKYLFPGISGPEMIDTSHWLGALCGVRDVIGIKETPVRKMIDAAASTVPVPVTLISLVVQDDGLAGVFVGDLFSAWNQAADLSATVHIERMKAPFSRVLSKASAMYDELWTAAKAMYKVESVVEDGGELILYAPHLEKVSDVHGLFIYEIGYHVIDYFLEQWKLFENIPLSVIAHSTHLKGAGTFRNGVEAPRIKVTLASRISPEDCERLNLGYLNPQEIKESEWENREEQGILYVPKAGETLYRFGA